MPGRVAGTAREGGAPPGVEFLAVRDMGGSVYPRPGIVIRPGLAYIAGTVRMGPEYFPSRSRHG